MKFTEEELQNIISDYKNGMPPYKLAEKYKRDSGTIIGKLQRLGIYKNKNYRFTKEDIKFLKEHYPKGDFDSIFKRFPNMTKQNIFAVCSKHGISADYYYDTCKWTNDELDIVQKYYFEKTLEELYEMLKCRHTMDAIQTKALKGFGYSKDRVWTIEELDTLKAYFSYMPIEDMCDKLPRRTRQAIEKQASNLGLRSYISVNTRWTKEEEALLFANWRSMTDDDLALLIGKDRRSILNKRWHCGLLRFNRSKDASYENVAKYIRGNIGSWKSSSAQSCDYKCVLTGSKDFHIHHLYSFSTIFNEILEENNITLKDSLSDYSEEELSFILDKFIKKQSQYPLGVCVRADLHALFHKVYGKIVTPDMWYKFEKEYREGKYVS